MDVAKTFTIGGIEFDTRLTLVIIFTTLVPMLDAYGHSPMRWLLNDFLGMQPELTKVEYKAFDRLIFYLVLPMLVIHFGFKEPAAAYGWQWGNWREGLLWTAGAAIGMTAILWFVARTPEMAAFYQGRAPEEIWRLVYATGLDLLGWEFIWRGFLLFFLARYFGPGAAIFLQAVPFAFMHLGKPELETLSTIFGGAAFGFVAWRTQSFVYPFLIHWYVASFTQVIALWIR